MSHFGWENDSEVREELHRLFQQSPHGAILKTDIVGSTDTAMRLGDRAYHESVLGPYLEQVHQIVRQHSGFYIKNIGDSVLAFFPASADQALAAAIAIQRYFSGHPIIHGKWRLRQRVALHYGRVELVKDDGRWDIIYNSVAVTARVEDATQPDQVILTGQMREHLSAAPPVSLHHWGAYTAKGVPENLDLFEARWDESLPLITPTGAKCRPVKFFDDWLTPFIGRAAELAQVQEWLCAGGPANRSIVILGMGGMGKTRLAFRTAEELYRSSSFPGEVFIVSFADVSPQLETWVDKLARRVMGPENYNPRDREGELARFLEHKTALLVLDNLEGEAKMEKGPQAPFSSLVDRLLGHCPGLTVLATSQHSRELDGWRNFSLEAMVVPEQRGVKDRAELEGLDSCRLFLTHAEKTPTGFSLDDRHVPDLARLLHLTSGVPLVIEIMAAWAGKRTIAEMADGLEGSIADVRRRLPGNTPDRQVSLTAGFDYSCGLLSAPARETFLKLSAFAGGFSTRAFEVVVGDDRQNLDELVSANLVRFDPDAGRYRLPLHVGIYLRDMAEGKLNIEVREGLAGKQAIFFLIFLDQTSEMTGRAIGPLLKTRAMVREEDANLDRALDWSFRQIPKIHLLIAQRFGTFLILENRFEKFLRVSQKALAAAQALGDKKKIAIAEGNLGLAYENLPTGDRGENLLKSIACFQNILRIYTERDFPVEWAQTMNNQGIAYQNLPSGDRGENLAKAIIYYQNALRVYTEHDFPPDWAMTMNNLGNAYQELPSGDRGDNLRKAIDCYQDALRVYTERDFTQDWAMTMNNLGTAYQELPSGDRGDNLRKAIECFQNALQVRTEHDFPMQWALTMDNLGNAYADLPAVDRGENFRKAIECYQNALRVRTEHDFPMQWADTMNNLGIVYGFFSADGHGEYSRKAIECYQNALRVRTERDFPLNWSRIMNNLAKVYRDLPSGDRGANLRQAIECCQNALRIRTERDFPGDFATTSYNLGLCFNDMAEESGKTEWRDRARACFIDAERAFRRVGMLAKAEQAAQAAKKKPANKDAPKKHTTRKTAPKKPALKKSSAKKSTAKKPAKKSRRR